MAVSKRTRFEVLRRDDYTCQYCGAKAPDAVLHVDHVLPVALGGDDKPGNLVAACRDCNSGKASVDPGSPLVQSLSDRAAAYALGMLERLAGMRAAIEEGDEYCAQFEQAWNGWTNDQTGETVPLPPDYESTLHRWYRMGVPIRMIELAVPKAMSLQWPKGEFGRFKYLCGVVWNQIDDQDVDYTLTQDTARIYTRLERDEYGVEAYERGRSGGLLAGRNDMYFQMVDSDIVTHHIDGTSSEWIDTHARVTNAA